MNIYLATLLLILGICAHFLKKLADEEDQGVHITPLSYLRQHPYRAACMVLSAFLLMLLWHWMEMLNPPLALLTGVGCSSAADTLRQRAEARLTQ